MRITNFIKYFLGITCLLSVYACQPELIYYTYEPIPEEGWKRQDTLRFSLPDSLSPGSYNMEIGIRHLGKYAYRDLWLELTHFLPNATPGGEWIEKKDTIHIYLANEKGSWVGTGTTGGHFQLLYHTQPFYFPSDALKDNGKNNFDDASDGDSEYAASMKQDGVFNTTKQPFRKKYTIEGKKHSLGKSTKYQLKIVHIMSDSLLMHITDIGIKLSSSTGSDQIAQ